MRHVDIQDTIPHLTTKDEQSNVVKKTLMLALLEGTPRKHGFGSTRMGLSQTLSRAEELSLIHI